MKTLWIAVCITLVIAFVEAQRNINLSKPVVSLEKRPRVPTWRRPPEERKKLSIFPKNNKKFVVTERTTLKSVVTTPVTATKRPLMRKLFVQDKNGKNAFTYPPRKALMEPKRFNVPIVPIPKQDSTRNFKSKINEPTAEESTIKTVVTSVRTESSVNSIKLNKGNLIQVLDSINKATGEKINEQPNTLLKKQETKVVQNYDVLKVNLPDKVFEDSVTEEIVTEGSVTEVSVTEVSVIEANVTEESVTQRHVTEKSANNKGQNVKAGKIEEQVEKVTENIILSKQEDKVIQNNASSLTKSYDQDSDEYEYEDISYEDSEANGTTTNINQQVSESNEKVFLSKHINIAIQHNKLLKVNLSDNVSNDYAVEKKNSLSATTPAQIINNVEYESTTHVSTEEPLSFNEPFEGRSLDSKDIELNDQSDHLLLDLSNRTEKMADFSKLAYLEILMTEIVRDTWSDSDQKPSLSSNVIKPDINEKTIKSHEFEERPGNYYEVKPAINKGESKVYSGNNGDAAVTEVTKNTNTENNKSIINVDLINNVNDTVEVTTANFTSADMIAFTESSPLLRLDLNINEEYTERTGIVSSGYEETTPRLDSLDNLTESPIEITFDNLKRPSAEEISNEPYINDTVVEVSQKYENENTNTLIEIDNSNKVQNVNDENSQVIDDLHNLAAFINDKSTDSDGSEVTFDKKQLVNLDMTIFEEYSDKPDILVNTTETEGSIQKSYSNDISLTESPVEIIFDGQGALIAEKLPFESIFNKNVNETDIEISASDDVVIEDSLNSKDVSTNIIYAIENLGNEQNVNEKNSYSAIENNLPDLDEVINDDSNIQEKSDITIDGTQFINERANKKDEDTVKPDTDIALVDGTFGTHEAYAEGGYVSDAPIGMLLNDHEQLSANATVTNNINDSVTNGEVDTISYNQPLSIVEDDNNKLDLITVVIHGPLDTQNAYDGDVTDAPMSIIFNESEPADNTNESEQEQLKIVTVVPELSQKVEDIIETLVIEQNDNDNTNSPSFADTVNIEAIFDGTNEEGTSEPQLVNTGEENSDKSKTTTVVFDGTTQKTYLNDEHVDIDHIGILFDNLEPLGQNKLLPSRSLKEETNESVTYQSNDHIIFNEATTEKATSIGEDISDEWLGMSSSPSSEITSNEPIILKSNNLTGEDLLNESNAGGEDISSESIVDNFITKSDGTSNESSVIDSSSILKHEEISGEIVAEADQLKDLMDDVSDKSHVLSEISGSVVINEEISDKKIADKSENTSEEILNEPYIVNGSSSNTVANADISDEKMADKSENLTDEISNEFTVVNEISNGFLKNEDISEEKTAETSENTPEEILNKPYIFNDSSSSVVTNEDIPDEKLADKTENMTEENSNESRISNETSSSIVTNEEISDEKITDKSENMTDEISDEFIIVKKSSSSFVINEDISDENIADTSENMTQEILTEPQIVNDSSSSVVTNADISDEKMTDKSENLTDEISNEFIIVKKSSSSFVKNEDLSDEIIANTSQNMTKEILTEPHIVKDSSSSVITNSDLSDEKMSDKSENLTDEISNEFIIVKKSSSSFLTNEEISDEKKADKSENITDEISNESYNENESSRSIITSEKMSDETIADKSDNLTDEIPNKSPVTDLSGEEVFDKVTVQPNDDTSEDNGPAIDIRHPSTELASNKVLINRRKRSNNIIEEENLATTLSGFKYTGHETRLGHNLSFKNINA